MKTVLAFSGGLDTSYCAIHLARELNHEVHAVTVNTGGFSEDEIRQIEMPKAWAFIPIPAWMSEKTITKKSFATWFSAMS